MLRLQLVASFIVFSLLLTDANVAEADEWENLGDIDGVQVSRMELEGSDVLAFRGDLVADVHIGQILSVFADPSEREHWVNRYGDHEVLEKTSTSELYWIRFDLPFPISDRDYLLSSEVTFNDSTRSFVANIESVTDQRKGEQDCCVRAVTETYYQFWAIPGSERTRVRVEVHTDPKGRIPTSLVNRIQRSWPADTLNGLIDRASRSGVETYDRVEDWHER